MADRVDEIIGLLHQPNEAVPPRKCGRCGTIDETVSTHSGADECSGCWNYRKLDLPAAEHWARVAKEFLSNVDLHDLQTYLPKALEGDPAVNISFADMLRAVQAVMVHSERVIEDGPYHKWNN